MPSDPIDDLPQLAAELVLAYASGNEVAATDLPALLSSFHQALAGLRKEAALEAEPQQPAVPIRSSVKPDYLICLEDGRKLKMLKRYLQVRHGMTPAQYREKWKLPGDYPMVAPAYAATRRAIAQQNGLGRKSVAPKLPAPKSIAPEAAAPMLQLAPPPAAPKLAATKPVLPRPRAPMPQATLSAPILAPPVKRKLLRPLFLRDSDPVRAQEEEAAPDVEGIKESEPAMSLLRQAIGWHRCVRTTYNKRTVTLAPHIVFARHDELYLRAVTVEQEGRKPREWKLGTFKIAGLGPVIPTSTPFVLFAGYQVEADQTQNIVYALPQA